MKKFLIPPMLFALSATVKASPLPNVEIYGFTTEHYPLKHSDQLDELYFIDKMKNTMNEVYGNLPNTEEKALQELAKRKASPDWQQKIEAVKTSTTDLVTAWSKGIKRTPAILFVPQGKRPQVIYGETDVSKAIHLFKKHQTKENPR